MPRKGSKTKASKAKAGGARKGQHPNSLAALTPFEKGQSGNPAGRPPGSRNFKTVISALLDYAVNLDTIDLGDKSEQVKDLLRMRAAELGGEITWREAAIIVQAHKALVRGDTFALSFLADREEGRPKQMVDIKARSYADFLDDLPDPPMEGEDA